MQLKYILSPLLQNLESYVIYSNYLLNSLLHSGRALFILHFFLKAQNGPLNNNVNSSIAVQWGIQSEGQQQTLKSKREQFPSQYEDTLSNTLSSVHNLVSKLCNSIPYVLVYICKTCNSSPSLDYNRLAGTNPKPPTKGKGYLQELCSMEWPNYCLLFIQSQEIIRHQNHSSSNTMSSQPIRNTLNG